MFGGFAAEVLRNCKEGGEPTGVGSSPSSRSSRLPCFAPEALLCAQNKIRLVLSIHTALGADTNRVEKRFFDTAFQSE